MPLGLRLVFERELVTIGVSKDKQSQANITQKFPRGVSKDFARCLTRSSRQWSLSHGRFQFAEEAWAQMGVPSMAAIAQEAGLSPHWANVLRDTSCSERSLLSVAGNSMHVSVVGVFYLNLLETFNP